jgi:hypothetical protein
MATRQHILRIRVLAGNSPFLANLNTCQNGLFQKCAALARLADIRQPVLRGLARLAEFGASGHCLVFTQNFHVFIEIIFCLSVSFSPFSFSI